MSTYRIRYEYSGTDTIDIDGPDELSALDLFDHFVRTNQITLRPHRISVKDVQ